MRSPILIVVWCAFAGFSFLGHAGEDFDAWASRFAERWVRLHPQAATTQQYLAPREQERLDRRLAPEGGFGLAWGRSFAGARASLARQGLSELDRFSSESLTPMQRSSRSIIRWDLEQVLKGQRFARHWHIFNQFMGYQLTSVSFLTASHPIRNARDVDTYLSRLEQLGASMDSAIAESKAAARMGVLPPSFILDRMLEQLDGFLSATPGANPLVASLRERMERLGGEIAPMKRAEALSTAERLVTESVLPAYRRVRALILDQRPFATDAAGAWRLPDGEAFYIQALEKATTTRLTPAEIHQLGLREVARIETEMDAGLKALGYGSGSIQERIEKLNQSLALPAEPDPRPQLLAKVDAAVRDAERRAVSVFDLRPKAPIEVRREPPFSEKSASAHYTSPAPDGSSPGIYWLPLADLGPRVMSVGSALRSTVYHEAVPGHHFQIALQQESETLPRYRKLGVFGSNSAFAEGWALYAERLADENGWYDGDPVGRLGYLHAQLFRARRLVVDTGLHAQKWTRQQVIDYGMPVSETERYIVWPGQACSYLVGQIRLVELREKARAALGAKFSIQAFHNLVLQGGMRPLEVVAEEVDDWIARVSK